MQAPIPTTVRVNSSLRRVSGSAACNYDPTAIYAGECEWPEQGLDCEGNCLADADGDGVCNADEIEGCTDENAVNYDAEATEDDGSCIDPVQGCTNMEACNYDLSATSDDGSCEFESCAGVFHQRLQLDPTATLVGECEFLPPGSTAMETASQKRAEVVPCLRHATTTLKPHSTTEAVSSSHACRLAARMRRLQLRLRRSL